MPLTRFMNEQLATVRGFLADPDAVLLEIRCVDEQLPALAKVLVNFGEHEDGEDVMVGVDGDLDAPEGLGDALQVSLTEATAEVISTFAAKRVPLHEPPWIEAPPHPDPVREHRLAEYAERLAQSMAPFVRNLVLVIKARTESEPTALRESLGRLSRALHNGRVKLIALSDPEMPVAREVDVERPRVRPLEPDRTTEAALATSVREFLAEPLARMLTHDGPGNSWARRQAAALTTSPRHWVVDVHGLRFGTPLHYFGRATELALRQLHAQAERRGLADASSPWLEGIDHPRVEADAERFFATTLLEYADAVVPPTDRIVVLLEPGVHESASGERTQMTASLHRLARELTSPRLRVLAVAPGARPPLPAEGILRTREFRIDDQVIEQGLREKLKEPDLSPLIRLRCISSLASFAMTRGEPEEGMRLSVESLELAREMDDPIEEGVAWYGLGNALYRCAALDQAADAYARAVDIALARDHAVLAAQGLTGMGHCHFVIGQPDLALEHYTIAHTYYDRLGNAMMEVYVLSWMAESHVKAGRDGPAEETFQRALARCQEAEPTIGEAAHGSEAEIRQRLARFYADRGLRPHSHEQQRRAEALGPVAPLADHP